MKIARCEPTTSLKCGVCSKVLEWCDNCYRPFLIRQEIICDNEGKRHFCTYKCLESYNEAMYKD